MQLCRIWRAKQNNKDYLNQQLRQLIPTTLRGNQLPAALKESHVSVNWYINPTKKGCIAVIHPFLL